MTRDGTTYIAVEDLFKDIGGIAYYSPIMKKVNLKYGRLSWVLSLDKGVAVSDGREIPLDGKVFVENNKVYVSLEVLAELFGFRVTQKAPETPSPSPQEAQTPSPRKGLPTLSRVRFASYDQEMRTRITFDFQGDDVPPFTFRVDRAQNAVLVTFRNCTLGDVSSSFPVNDARIGTLTLKEEEGGVRVTIPFKGAIQVQEGKLDGANPRAYFDLVSLVEITEESPAPPSPRPSPLPSPRPRPSPSPVVTPSPSFETINRNVVVLDPGHGGNDPGCVHNEYQEKTIVLAIAQKVKNLLESRGYRVYMTRESDVYPSLDDRYNLANSKNPFVFVSIHCNASPNPKASGVEVFVGGSKPRGEGALDVATRENATFLAEQSSILENSSKLNSIYTSAYYLKSREASAKLAELVVQEVSESAGLPPRGVKEAPLVVLGHMFYPACLVEVGFLSNPAEAKKLASSSFQERIAKGIADAIEAFAKSPELAKLLGG